MVMRMMVTMVVMMVVVVMVMTMVVMMMTMVMVRKPASPSVHCLPNVSSLCLPVHSTFKIVIVIAMAIAIIVITCKSR